jgi:sugar phosphate permease
VVPLHLRAMAANAKTMGVPLLVSFGAFFAPVLGQAFTWHVPLIVAGSVAAFSFVITLLVIPDVSSPRTVGVSARPPAGFWRMPFAAFFLLVGSQPVYSWSISYLTEELLLGKLQAGSVIGVASLIGAANMVVLGQISDRLGLSSRRIFLIRLTAGLSISQVVVALPVRLPIVLCLLAITFAIVAQLAAIGTMHALIIDLCPGAAGRGSGLTMTGYYFGALAAPVTFGFLTDLFSYSVAWAYCAVCAALSMVFFWSVRWIQPPAAIERSSEPS